MAFDAFIKIPGADGESSDEKHSKWIELHSYGFGLTQPTGAGSRSDGGGAITGRVNLEAFTCTKSIDISSAKLALMCAKGKAIDGIVVHLNRAAEDKVLYLEIKYDNAVITKSSVTGSGDDLPEETLEFNYGKVDYMYYETAHDSGKLTGNKAGFLWSAITNSGSSK